MISSMKMSGVYKISLFMKVTAERGLTDESGTDAIMVSVVSCYLSVYHDSQLTFHT